MSSKESCWNDRTGYRLRKVKCKFKPNLALAWRTSADPVVLWLSSFVAVPCLINRTRCILPTPPILLTPRPPTHTHKEACVWMRMAGSINYLCSGSSNSHCGNWAPGFMEMTRPSCG